MDEKADELKEQYQIFKSIQDNFARGNLNLSFYISLFL